MSTSSGEIRCRCVVLASGACNVASVPAIAAGVPPSIAQVTPFDYGNPDRLPEGGVLVVGGSATGVQLAAEIQQSGRPVTLSVGEHVRLPRTYRGRDVLWWMDASGLWNQRYDEIDDLTRARRLPSPQLVGTAQRSTLDLNALTAMGVALVGRLSAIRDGRALFSGGLRNVFALADLKMERLLTTFDEWARATGRDADVGAPERFEPTRVPAASPLQLDLRGGAIRSIVWATGFHPDYSWLHVPVLDEKGQLMTPGRRGRGARDVCAGPAGPAPPEVDLHPRHRGRRARRHRSPRWVSGRRRPAVERPGGAMNRRTAAAAGALLLIVSTPPAAHGRGQERHTHHAAAEVSGLGAVSFANSGAAAAQPAFQRGLAFLHSFEYDQAAEAFRAAQTADPSFAMAFWGEALTYSHLLWGEDDADAARRALGRLGAARDARLAKAGTPRERAFGEAIEALFVDGTLAGAGARVRGRDACRGPRVSGRPGCRRRSPRSPRCSRPTSATSRRPSSRPPAMPPSTSRSGCSPPTRIIPAARTT